MFSPVHGDLPVTLNRNRHPVQISTVVRGVDATKHHHAATLVIAMERGGGGDKTGIHHSLINLSVYLLCAF